LDVLLHRVKERTAQDFIAARVGGKIVAAAAQEKAAEIQAEAMVVAKPVAKAEPAAGAHVGADVVAAEEGDRARASQGAGKGAVRGVACRNQDGRRAGLQPPKQVFH